MPGRKRARTDKADAQRERPERHSANPHAGAPDASRSAESIEEGGQNERRGEPPEGYFTVAPGKQQGGKR